MNYETQHPIILTPRDRTRALIREVAERHGVTLGDVLGRSRMGRHVRARRAAIVAVIRARPHMSLPQIGRIFGYRDHTTAMHHCAVAGLPMRKAQPVQQMAAE